MLLLDGQCPPPATCDFDKDMCSYSNDELSDEMNWFRTKKYRFYGFNAEDHTLQNGQGNAIIYDNNIK